jgi:osmoprotectant transport system permease protein
VSAVGDVVAWFADPEHWSGPSGVPTRVVEHLGLTAAALGIACAIAVPLALWLGHLGRGGPLAVNLANVGRAVPTFAVLVLLAIGPLGFGPEATITALVLFAIPPILTNGYVGMREVDRDVVEAARGVGLSPLQVVRRVELPLAVPLLLNGIRLAAVQVIATATIAAWSPAAGSATSSCSASAPRTRPRSCRARCSSRAFARGRRAAVRRARRALDPLARQQQGDRSRSVTRAGMARVTRGLQDRGCARARRTRAAAAAGHRRRCAMRPSLTTLRLLAGAPASRWRSPPAAGTTAATPSPRASGGAMRRPARRSPSAARRSPSRRS